jgi:hypothetical protein
MSLKICSYEDIAIYIKCEEGSNQVTIVSMLRAVLHIRSEKLPLGGCLY